MTTTLREKDREEKIKRKEKKNIWPHHYQQYSVFFFSMEFTNVVL